MNNFLIGVGGLGLLFLWCLKNTKPVRSGSQNPTPLTLNLKQYADTDSEWSNPMNLTTNERVVKESLREAGPFGVDRVVYEGVGESWNSIYSDNYVAL